MATGNTAGAADAGKELQALIVTPVLNDWECLGLLLPQLEEALRKTQMTADVLVVDDGSEQDAPRTLVAGNYQAIQHVLVLRLTRNLGHQRAIATALPYVAAKMAYPAIVVMDADGEDQPQDVPRLLQAARNGGGERVVFALRQQRAENMLFRVFYFFYRCTFRLLTGQDIRIGNFSVVPAGLLRRIVTVSEIGNHYAAGVMKARLPCRNIPCDRGPRLAGRPRMNLVSLVTHGLSAVSVYGDVVGTRALLALGSLTLAICVLAGAAVFIRLATDLAIPGWATYVVGLSIIILLQALTLSVFFVFLVLQARNTAAFVPTRDYHHFILDVTQIYPAP